MNACIPVKGNCKEFLYVSTDKYSIAQIAVYWVYRFFIEFIDSFVVSWLIEW